MITRRTTLRGFLAAALAATLVVAPAANAQERPDELIRTLSTSVLDTIRSDEALQKGDFAKLSDLVDRTIMPNVNFERMTALAVGRGWREANEGQRKRLIDGFRVLLLRTYSGALSQVRNQRVRMKPLRASPGDDEVIVRSEIVGGRGDPIQLDYRMEKAGEKWRIYDVNVLGVWLVETYRNQFGQLLNERGVDGLIDAIDAKNRDAADRAKAT